MAQRVTSGWDATDVVVGAGGPTKSRRDKGAGIGYDPVAMAGEVRSMWPGVRWADVNMRGRALTFYVSENSDGTGHSVEALRLDSTGLTVFGTPVDLRALLQVVRALQQKGG